MKYPEVIFLHKYQIRTVTLMHTYTTIIHKQTKKLELKNKIRIFIALPIVLCIYCCNFASIVNKYTIYLHKVPKMNNFSFS